MIIFLLIHLACYHSENQEKPIKLRVFAGIIEEFGEPFGLAVDKNGNLYVSDGGKGVIFRVSVKTKRLGWSSWGKKTSREEEKSVEIELVADNLQTPSQIAFDSEGFLIVADSGSHTIKRINVQTGEAAIIAGVEGKRGFADGIAETALFNAPVGIAVWRNKIFVADTYNDKIRIIEDGIVRTLAGSSQGFADGVAGNAKFNTPTTLAVFPDGGLVVNDFSNGKLRKVSQDGRVETLELAEETLFPMSVAVKNDELIFADSYSLYRVKKAFTSESIVDKFGFPTRLLRPSSIAIDEKENVFIADSDSRLITVVTKSEEFAEVTEETISRLAERECEMPLSVRWCYEPPDRKRDIAGTFCEIRGELQNREDEAWFHNGIDIAGGYGETAYFVQAEKVLLPNAVSNFGNLREGLKMPKFGYIHINLGRYADGRIFADERFQFSFDENGKPIGLRIARGTKFEEGEPIGTLNAMNHVHLTIGVSGYECNPLEVLSLPNVSDKIAPTIEKVELFDKDWNKVETEKIPQLSGKVRIVVEAFDRMDGNPQRRKLGVYRVGYQVFQGENLIIDKLWTMSFSRLPNRAESYGFSSQVPLVYALGSRAGPRGESFFKYIVSNELDQNGYVKENFLDIASLNEGKYTLKVSVADFFGNTTSREIEFIKQAN